MPKHILVVDDDVDLADATVETIHDMGQGEFTAEAVYGGQACLDRIAKGDGKPIDLIMLDLGMENVNGVDVIRALIKINPLPTFKVLVATAYGEQWKQQMRIPEVLAHPHFQRLVCAETLDKKDDVEDMVPLLKKVLGGVR
jgi:CheY-like chemotaxis protein